MCDGICQRRAIAAPVGAVGEDGPNNASLCCLSCQGGCLDCRCAGKVRCDDRLPMADDWWLTTGEMDDTQQGNTGRQQNARLAAVSRQVGPFQSGCAVRPPGKAPARGSCDEGDLMDDALRVSDPRVQENNGN